MVKFLKILYELSPLWFRDKRYSISGSMSLRYPIIMNLFHDVRASGWGVKVYQTNSLSLFFSKPTPTLGIMPCVVHQLYKYTTNGHNGHSDSEQTIKSYYSWLHI